MLTIFVLYFQVYYKTKIKIIQYFSVILIKKIVQYCFTIIIWLVFYNTF